MKRFLSTYLDEWLASPDRKPLILRGARQVGKTWLVRNFAGTNKKELLELNFEKQPDLATLFNSNDPQRILLNVGASLNKNITVENSLLFLDEIQVVPELLSKLRWFAEELPQLPVIAAGSLLEFVLGDHAFSMPVGRVSYAHLEPMSFEEFLLAQNKIILYEFLTRYHFDEDVPENIHKQLLDLFKEYILIGGMPAVVSNWVKNRTLGGVYQIQQDLLSAYRDDFNKYKGRIDNNRLDEVMKSIPKMLGKKFVFRQVNPEIPASTIKKILSLFEKARISHRVTSCLANGIPLAAEKREKFFKEIFLDVGLCSAELGIGLIQMNIALEINLINSGGVAEQVTGQLLRTIAPAYVEPALYYWLREESGSNAEIDYVIQHQNKVIPIEVKAGATGGLKSLHLYMGLKKSQLAVRINSARPSKTPVKVKYTQENEVEYTLLSIPFYLIGQLHRLLDAN